MLQRWRQLQDDKYVNVLQTRQQESSALEYISQLQALQRQATEMRRNANRSNSNYVYCRGSAGACKPTIGMMRQRWNRSRCKPRQMAPWC